MAALIDMRGASAERQKRHGRVAVIDPCAGDGAAVLELTRLLGGDFHASSYQGVEAFVYAAEMERSRASQLGAAFKQLLPYGKRENALHSDAFNLIWETSSAAPGAHLLFLNPPYDYDREYERLEQRWLARFTASLIPGEGILMFVVPYYALNASAEYIARHYEPQSLYCYRFPDGEWEAYKQVVLLARRRQSPLPEGWVDEASKARVQAWAANPDGIPTLPKAGTSQAVLGINWAENAGFAKWQAASCDLSAVTAALRIGRRSAKNGQLVENKGWGLSSLAEMFARPIEVVMPPRAAHLANALACDFFNGAAVEPNDGVGAKGLIKARFIPTNVTVDEKVNAKGKVSKLIQVRQPVMKMTFLDLTTGRLHELKPGTTASGERDPDKMTIADLVEGYSNSLLRVMDTMCPPLHDPRRPDHLIRLPEMRRRLYEPQAHAAIAGLKLLARGENFILNGEIGSGKSITAVATAFALGPRHHYTTIRQLQAQPGLEDAAGVGQVKLALIVCPPHLLRGWRDQIELTLPAARVVVLNSIGGRPDEVAGSWPANRLEELRNVPAREGIGGDITFAILSREAAKLGSRMNPAIDQRGRCPDCGRVVAKAPDTLAARRARCEHQANIASTPLAKLTARLAGLVAAVDANITEVGYLVPSYQRLAAAREQVRADAPDVNIRWQHAALVEYRAHKVNPHLGHVTDLLPLPRFVSEKLLLAACNMGASYNPQGMIGRRITNPQLAAQVDRYGGLVEVKASDGTSPAATPLGAIITELIRLTIPPLEQRVNSDQLAIMLRAIVGLCVAMPRRDEFVAELATLLYELATLDEASYGAGASARKAARELALTLSFGSELQKQTEAELRRLGPKVKLTGSSSEWDNYDKTMRRLRRKHEGTSQPSYYGYGYRDRGEIDYTYPHIEIADGILTWNGFSVGDGHAAVAQLGPLVGVSNFRPGEPCDGPLYQVSAEPRRYPLADYISRYQQHNVDLLIVDEAHEYASEGSAQRQAVGRLIEMGKPTMMLTGSIMKGYADSLFANFWAIDRRFREKYGYKDIRRFIEDYAYLKLEVDLEGKDEGEASYGAMSDRRFDREDGKVIGLAPGVMPNFVPEWLLPRAVMIDLEALGVELPELSQIAVPVVPAPEDEWGQKVVNWARKLEAEVLATIRADRFQPGLAGKLMYALPMCATYADRATADTGRGKLEGEAKFVIRYPEDVGGGLVAAADVIPAGVLAPKEKVMVQLLKKERAEGRRTMIYMWNTSDDAGLMRRLAEIVKRRAGLKVAVLEAKKVDPGVRQDWIDREVIGKDVDVLIVNARAVETGLNNLVYFSSVIWYENPLCNAITFRQANGRIYRNGQQLPVRIYILFYRDTSQAEMMSLWMQKVSESLKTDGQDWQAALEAAGAGGADAPIQQHAALGEALYRKMSARGKVNSEYASHQTTASEAGSMNGAKQAEVKVEDVVQVMELSEVISISSPKQADTPIASPVGGDAQPQGQADVRLIFGIGSLDRPRSGGRKKEENSGQLSLF